MVGVESSGALLEALFIRYKAVYALKFPEAPPLQKKQVSSWVEGDSHALARWTNEKAHHGKYPNWRIPIRRIPAICEVLKATEGECDQLMVVRIQETFTQYYESSVAYETTSPEGVHTKPEMSDGLTIVSWLGPVLRLPARARVLNDEQVKVLDVFADAKLKAFGAVALDVDLEAGDQLRRAFDTFFEGAKLKSNPYVVEETEDAVAKLEGEKMRARLLAAMAANAAKRVVKQAAAKAPTSREVRKEVDAAEVSRRNNLLALVGSTPQHKIE